MDKLLRSCSVYTCCLKKPGKLGFSHAGVPHAFPPPPSCFIFQDDCIPDSCLAGNSRQLEAVFFIEAVFQKAVIDEARVKEAVFYETVY